MKKRLVWTLPLWSITLLSCGSISSSSVSSSLLSSQSVETEKPYFQANLTGELELSLSALLGQEETNVDVAAHGLVLDISGDYPMENIGHLLDYDYYQIANITGQARMGVLTISQVRGHGKLKYEYSDIHLPISEKEGTIYADFSTLDLKDLGLEAGKYYFPDAFAFLKEESVASLGGILSMLSFEVSTLYDAAASDAVIENAISMEAVDKKTYELRFALTSISLSHLASVLSGQEASELQASIDQYLTLREDSYLSIRYGALTQEVEAVGLSLSCTPKMEDIVFDENTTIRLNQSILRLSGEISWQGSEEFTMPDLEGYEEFPVTAPEETEASSWSSQG